jgi:hypothetical protein
MTLFPEENRDAYLIRPLAGSMRLEVAISALPHEYFANAQKIDMHNRLRQGILAFERNLSTRLGMIVFWAGSQQCFRHDCGRCLAHVSTC